MAEERKVKYWITVNGHHVPIFDVGDFLDSATRERYSRYIDDHSYDKYLDSDELTWVEMLRREKYGNQVNKEADRKEAQIAANKAEATKLNREEQDLGLKPWTKAEEKRTKEASDMVVRYNYAGENKNFMEFYDTDGEEVYRQDIGEEYGWRADTEAIIYKEHFVYKGYRDEDDNRVKPGKKVAGTTYYSVSMDGNILDENVAGYKTEADARHALAIELHWMKEQEAKRRAKKAGH